MSANAAALKQKKSADLSGTSTGYKIFAVVILSGGSQLGVLVSAFLFIGLPELMRGLTESRMLFFGLAMMLMMVWRPQGILPPLPRIYKKALARAQASAREKSE